MITTPTSLLIGKTKKELDKITAPSTSVARNFVSELPRAAYQTALNVLQGTARSGAGAVLTLTGKDKVSVDQSLPKIVKNVFAGIFGDTQKQPLRGFTGIGQETLQGFGAENLSQKKPLAFALGATLSVLDFTGAGGQKSAIKALTAANKADETFKLLKQINVADDLAKDYAPILAKTTKEANVVKLVDRISELQKSTQPTRKADQLVQGVQDEARITPSLQQGKISEITPKIAQKVGISPTQEVAPSAKLDFDKTSPKIYTPQAEQAIEATVKTLNEPKPIVKQVIDSLRETKTKVLEYVQNTDERVRQLVQKPDVKVNDLSNPYQKMTLYSGRVANKIEQAKSEAKAVIDEMVKNKVSRKEVSDYLYFRHAPERNLALGEKAAGITTKEAEAGLAKLTNPKIKELADKVQAINNQTLDLLRDSGVISDDLHKTLRTKYKNHVPLNRIFEDTEDIGQALSGKGFDVRSTGIKTAKGSEREVSDIFTNVLTNYEQAVLRAEKNIVDQSTLAFVRNNKDVLGDLFEVSSPKAIGKTFDEKMILERTQDPSVLQLFENGKRVWIKIKDPNLAIALRGIGKEKLGTLLNAVGSFTRLYSGLATRFNPEFFLPNKIRDLQETAVYLASQKDIGFKGALKTVARDPISVNDVLSALRGKTTEGAKLYNEMKSLGGTTGGFGLSTRKQVALNLDQLEKLANSKTRKIADNLVEYIDQWNTIFEDSTRLSVYKQALKQGLSKERAAFLAKEASINFNRMGKGGPIVNALWMFSNASIQGSTKMLRSLKDPKVLGATVATVGSAVAAVNEWNDKVDSAWRDKVSKWDRLNGLPVMLPSQDGKARYFTIPVSWGIKPIKVMTDYAYDALDGQKFNSQDMVEDTMTAMIEAYNPVGGTDLTSALVPTSLDVPVEIARNRSWSGVKLRPDYDPNMPADVQYFSSLGETKTGETAISISEMLQNKAGVAVSPADIKYGFDQYVGGAGRTIGKLTNLFSGLVTKKSPPLDEFPLISRFYKERDQEEIGRGTGPSEDINKLLEEQSRERFDMNRDARKVIKNFEGLSETEIRDRLITIANTDEELAKKTLDLYETEKLGLTFVDKQVKSLGVENGKRAEFIWSQIKSLPNKGKREKLIDLAEKKILTEQVLVQVLEMAK